MTRNLRTQLADLAERWLNNWGHHLTREQAALLLKSWDLAEPWDDETTAEVLGRFPASEPPAVPGLDFLPTLDCDCGHPKLTHNTSWGCSEIGCSCLEDPPSDVADAKAVVASLDVEVAPKVLTGEVTSPFGPCSGLAADKRDNTCGNFAAEYVEWAEGEATNLRRLCRACADSLPNVVSRQPLTMAPGGAALERVS